MEQLNNFLSDFGDALLSVQVLLSNKYSYGKYTISSENLVKTFEKRDTVFTGFGSREFYATVNGYDFTIQVSIAMPDTVDDIDCF